MAGDPAEHPAAPHDEEERVALRSIVDKYERMRGLRDRLGRGTPPPEERALMRELADQFPGALRELEMLSTDQLDARLAIARTAAQGGAAPAWLLWTALYHRLMRHALKNRRALARQGPEAQPLPHGRLNVVVFAALAQCFGLEADLLWDRLFPATGQAPRPYRAPRPPRG